MTDLLLGVDGGATKTIALVARGDGSIIGWGRDGSSDIHGEPDPELPIQRVAAAVRTAAAAADVPTSSLSSCVFSLCGADWPEDMTLFEERLTDLLQLSAHPIVMNDALGALRAGTEDGIGVVLSLGTGGAVGARGPGGDEWFSGMRLEPSGALEFGRTAQDLLVRGRFGGGPVPGFEAAALAEFEVGSVDDLLHVVNRRDGLRERGLARLAAVLLAAAERDDAMAVKVVESQIGMLARYVRDAAERVGLGTVGSPLVVTGGVLRRDHPFVLDTIAAAVPAFDIVHPRHEPAVGALLWAADMAGASISTSALESSTPPASLFKTIEAIEDA